MIKTQQTWCGENQGAERLFIFHSTCVKCRFTVLHWIHWVMHIKLCCQDTHPQPPLPPLAGLNMLKSIGMHMFILKCVFSMFHNIHLNLKLKFIINLFTVWIIFALLSLFSSFTYYILPVVYQDFILSYVLPFGHVFQHHNASFHWYTPIYLPMQPGDPRSLAALLKLSVCIYHWCFLDWTPTNPSFQASITRLCSASYWSRLPQLGFLLFLIDDITSLLS